jgi:hypothetical protein
MAGLVGTQSPAGTVIAPAPSGRPMPTPLASLPPGAADFTPDATVVADCLPADLLCVSQAYGNVAYAEGPKIALARLEQAMAGDPEIAAGCHRVAHVIGGASLYRLNDDVGSAFAAGSGVCWSGYYHGILERVFHGVEASDVATLSRLGAAACASPVVRETPFSAYNCLHGLGHGFMLSTGYDLPSSIEGCRQADPSQGIDWSNCMTGVLMENQQTTYGVESPWNPVDDPEFPCRIMDAPGRQICAGFIGVPILLGVNGDFAAAAAGCAAASPDLRSGCFSSLGNTAVGGVSWEPAEIAAACDQTAPGVTDCYVGAALSLTAHYEGADSSLPFCRAGRDEAVRVACLEAIGVVLADMSPTAAAARARCDALPIDPTESAACLRGAARPMRPHPDA